MCYTFTGQLTKKYKPQKHYSVYGRVTPPGTVTHHNWKQLQGTMMSVDEKMWTPLRRASNRWQAGDIEETYVLTSKSKRLLNRAVSVFCTTRHRAAPLTSNKHRQTLSRAPNIYWVTSLKDPLTPHARCCSVPQISNKQQMRSWTTSTDYLQEGQGPTGRLTAPISLKSAPSSCLNCVPHIGDLPPPPPCYSY